VSAMWKLGAAVAIWLAVSPNPQSSIPNPQSPNPQSLEVFRVFLTDGRILHSYGECATLPEELVCVVKLGGGAVGESHDVLTVPLVMVDEARTREYARALRAAQYAATRGEREYTEMTTELTRVMAEVEASTDTDRRLGIAVMARQRLAGWSAEHFDYKAAETRQLVAMLDEVIAELRIAAGDTKFAIDMAANLAPPEPQPLLAAPDLSESLQTALLAAEVTPIAAERLSLLRSVQRVAAATPGLDGALRRRITQTLQTEEAIDRKYRTLMQDAMTRADAAVRSGRVSQLQRLVSEVHQRDQKLGARRPREMAALGRRLDIELQQAREQRVAFVRWTTIKSQLLAYEVRVRAIFDGWVAHRPVLLDLREEKTGRASALDSAVRRFTTLDATLGSMQPLPEVREVHALLRSAVQMARQGLILGQRVAVARNAEVSRNASSAVAGAELLLEQGRTELIRSLFPRKVR
jgi:hypothetical protein